MYVMCGIYWHPNGNVGHFVNLLEAILFKVDSSLAGDINTVRSRYIAVFFSPNNSRETPLARPLGMGVFCEILIWQKLYLRIKYSVCGIVLYGTVIYRESIVLSWWNY